MQNASGTGTASLSIYTPGTYASVISMLGGLTFWDLNYSNTFTYPGTISINMDCRTNGLNGLDTGSWTTNHNYFLYAIYNSQLQTCGGLFSLYYYPYNGQNPAMPGGWGYLRMIGMVVAASPGTIVASFQNDGDFFFASPRLITNSLTKIWAQYSVPSPYKLLGVAKNQMFVGMGCTAYTSGNIGVAVSLDGTNQFNSLVISDNLSDGARQRVDIPGAASLYAKKIGVGAGTPAIYVMGYNVSI